MVKSGKEADGAMDGGNMLNLLWQWRITLCVGATTLDEYRQYIEKRCGFRASFPKVYVAEPTVEDTHRHFACLKERYELHHRMYKLRIRRL